MLTKELQILQEKLNRGWKSMVGLSGLNNNEGSAIGLHDFYEIYWDDPPVLFLKDGEAERLGFSPLDAKIIEEVGLPEWAAPNMFFHKPELLSKEIILIGEDREDRPIHYRINDRWVYAMGDGSIKLISVGLDGLVFTLVIYAAMVELAIEKDRDACRLNRIPSFLIDRLRLAYCREFGDLYENGFVEEQVMRLSDRRDPGFE
ncbi:hypothetical protein GCM10007863_16900 [Dyella mobilis]|nr:hypothetical protein GCM10007863_16900 [Dyella mobilis]